MRAIQARTVEDESDESLVARIVDGDHQAFAQLVHRHSRRLFAYAWRMSGDGADAEDSVQDAFLKLWRNPKAFDPGRGNKFLTWFYKVVGNAVIDRQRKKRETPDTDALDFAVSAAPLQDQAMQESEQASRLEQAIRSLPERQQTALNLCFYEGVSNAEAAKAIGVHVKALESLLMRAKKTLKEKLAKDDRLKTENDNEQPSS